MAAFDLSTTPKQLAVAAGESGTVVVTVSNRMGQPVMGRVNHVVTPESAAAWIVPPAEPQRRFDGELSATLEFEYAVRVPADAPAGAISLRVDVFDVLAPDDHFVRGETVAIEVTAGKPAPPPPPTVPWWVWLVAAVVVLGAGAGIYFGVIRRDQAHVSGSLSLTGRQPCADLDSGTTSCSGGTDDIRITGSATTVLLAPANGATVAEMGTRSPGKRGCEGASHSEAGIDASTLKPGAYVCVVTSEGRHAEVKVTSVPPTNRTEFVEVMRRGAPLFEIDYRTFK